MVQLIRRIGLAGQLLLVGILLISKPSYALDLSIVGTGVSSKPYTSSNISNSFNQQLGLGGGILADIELNNYFSLQIGALYVTRSFSNSLNASNSIDQLQYLQMP